MRRAWITLSLALALGAAAPIGTLLAATGDPAAGQAGMTSRHGGIMSMTKGHAFETVVAPHGIRVYLYTDEHAPAMTEKATGVATLSLPGDKTVTVKLTPEVPGDKEPATYFCPMHAEVVRDKPGECELCGGMKLFKQDRLYGQFDFSQVKLDDVKATIRVTGMRGAEKEATFTPAFRTPDRKAEGTQSGNAMPGLGEMKAAATPGPGEVKAAAMPAMGSGCAMAKGAGTGSCCSGKAKASASGAAAGCGMKQHAEAGSTSGDTSPRGR
jgi:hypothetical protein